MHDSREERARFAAALQKVALVTAKSEKPDATIIRLYWSALKDFNIDTIEEAADQLLRVEAQMYALPPPGRWREVCQELYELRPERATYVDPRTPRCPGCDGTGWRPAEHSPGRVTQCECRTGQTPPPLDWSVMMTPLPEATEQRVLLDLDGELPAPAKETELEKRRREWGNHILTCACCKRPYRRRSGWRCCSPPSGMKPERWSDAWHRNCEGPGEHRCPQHCQHPVSARGHPRPVVGLMPMPEAGEHLDTWAKRTGLRDQNAPAPDLGESEWPEEPPPHTEDDLGF